MNNTLLLSYQIEYETTTATMDDLSLKYNTPISDFTNHQLWTKRINIVTTPIEAQNQHILVDYDDTPEEPNISIVTANSPIVDDTSPEAMMADIKVFKRKLLNNCIDFINKNAEYSEVKEIKDMAKIVSDLEDSFKDKAPAGPTINILMQNITEGFKDDC